MTIFLQALEVVAAQGQLFVCWLHNTQHTQHNIHQHNTTHNTQHSVLSTGLRVHGQHGESSLQFRLHILLCCQVVSCCVVFESRGELGIENRGSNKIK